MSTGSVDSDAVQKLDPPAQTSLVKHARTGADGPASQRRLQDEGCVAEGNSGAIHAAGCGVRSGNVEMSRLPPRLPHTMREITPNPVPRVAASFLVQAAVSFYVPRQALNGSSVALRVRHRRLVVHLLLIRSRRTL